MSDQTKNDITKSQLMDVAKDIHKSAEDIKKMSTEQNVAVAQEKEKKSSFADSLWAIIPPQWRNAIVFLIFCGGFFGVGGTGVAAYLRGVNPSPQSSVSAVPVPVKDKTLSSLKQTENLNNSFAQITSQLNTIAQTQAANSQKLSDMTDDMKEMKDEIKENQRDIKDLLKK